MEAADFILNKLEKELPENLYYHGVHHTRDVHNATKQICKAMGINGADLLLLETAALYHDAGFLIQYNDHEEVGCKLIHEMLPQFGYTNNQIDKVCELIRATKVPQKPTNILEKILCDADLDYLGRDDFEPIADTLFREFMAYGIVNSEEQWNRLQVSFLNSHRYFTSYSQSLREPKKKEHIYAIEKIVLTYHD